MIPVESITSETIDQILFEALDPGTMKLDTTPGLPTVSPHRVPDNLIHHPGKLETASVAAANHYNSPKTKFNRVAHMGVGTTAVFHGTTTDGEEYAKKPLSAGHFSHQPEKWVARGQAANRVADAIGAPHLGTEVFHGAMPDESRMHNGFINHPDENDSEEKQAKMHGSYVGQPAFVSKMVKNSTPASAATPEQLAKVPYAARRAGFLQHLITGAADGHHANSLINNDTYHTTNIDHDNSFGSMLADEFSKKGDDNQIKLNNEHGRRALMSVYAPGEDLDLSKAPDYPGPVGYDFTPEELDGLHKTAGGHLGAGLDDVDHHRMRVNAQELLDHGLERMIARRHIVPTHRRRAQEKRELLKMNADRDRAHHDAMRKLRNKPDGEA